MRVDLAAAVWLGAACSRRSVPHVGGPRGGRVTGMPRPRRRGSIRRPALPHWCGASRESAFRARRKRQAAAATPHAGLIDEGWKDTSLLLSGERVRMRMRFERYPVLFLNHCHNLEHEDAGMMRNFLIEA